MITDSETVNFLAYRYGIKFAGWNPYVRSSEARELPCYFADSSIKWSNLSGGDGYLRLRGGGVYEVTYILRNAPLFVHPESMYILEREPQLYTGYILRPHIGKNGQKHNTQYVERMKELGLSYVEPEFNESGSYEVV